jgi:antitoxin component YwqK of YwqJK toxin-antitoxin module
MKLGRGALVTAAVCLSGALGCRAGPCPPDTEVRGSREARQQSCEYQDSNGVSVKHGPFADWYPDGGKRSAGAYRHGKPDGVWRYWDESGRQTVEREYRDGDVVAERTH